MTNYQNDHHQYHRYYRRLRKIYQQPSLRDFTFLIISLFTVAFFSFFAIKPSLKTIGGLIKETKDKRMASKQLEQKINSLSLAQKEYLRVQPSLPYIYAALPKSNEFSKLIKQIEYLAGKNNISLVSLQLEEVDLLNSESSSPLHLSFEAKGQYSGLKAFLNNLENLERLVVFETFSFSQDKSGLKGPPLALTMEINSYYLP